MSGPPEPFCPAPLIAVSLIRSAQAVEPDRGADGGDVVRRSEQPQQAVVAAAADNRMIAAASLVAGLEDEAGVVIEVAREFG